MIECKPPQSIPVDVLLGGRGGEIYNSRDTNILLYTCTNSIPEFNRATTRGCYVTRGEEEERNQQLLLCALC